MLMHQALKKADVIIVLGNRDTRMARHAAQLYLDGWAPLLLCSGSGTIHNHLPKRKYFVGTTEAEVFAKIAIEMGVPADKIIIENESQTTAENFKFSLQKLKEHSINPKRIILVQKPYTERRVFSIGKIWFPEAELIVSSPALSFEQYPEETMEKRELLNLLVGAVDRVKKNPNNEYLIRQEIPQEVTDAYEYLVAQGYTEKLVLLK